MSVKKLYLVYVTYLSDDVAVFAEVLPGIKEGFVFSYYNVV